MTAFTKRILSLVLCIVLCASMCGCDAVMSLFETDKKGMVEDTSLGYREMDNSSFLPSAYYTPIQCRESYNYLDDDSKKLYDKLYQYVYFVYPMANADNEYKTKQVVLENIMLTETQIRLTIKALSDDNPQIFWLSTTFGFLINEKDNYTAVQLYSKLSPSALKNSMKQLKSSVESFYKTLRKNMTQYQLELLIHDYLLATCSYDKTIEIDDNGLPKDLTNAFDAYGALVEQKAVCEGYARAFQLLCNGVGIKCINIIGESQGELHMWNAVEIDANYYYIDTTWDDMDNKALKYDYFNITEEQLLHDHKFSKLASEMTDDEICGNGKINALTSNFYLPECKTTYFNYYERNAVHLKSFNADDVLSALEKAAFDKEEYLHIYIEPKCYNYDYAVDQLFFSYPQYFFTYAENVNFKLPDYSIDVNNVSVFQREQLYVVTVVLEYI